MQRRKKHGTVQQDLGLSRAPRNLLSSSKPGEGSAHSPGTQIGQPPSGPLCTWWWGIHILKEILWGKVHFLTGAKVKSPSSEVLFFCYPFAKAQLWLSPSRNFLWPPQPWSLLHLWPIQKVWGSFPCRVERSESEQSGCRAPSLCGPWCPALVDEAGGPASSSAPPGPAAAALVTDGHLKASWRLCPAS